MLEKIIIAIVLKLLDALILKAKKEVQKAADKISEENANTELLGKLHEAKDKNERIQIARDLLNS